MKQIKGYGMLLMSLFLSGVSPAAQSEKPLPPSGGRIVFSYEPSGGVSTRLLEEPSQIYAMDADGSHQTQLLGSPSHNTFTPSISRDGKRIVFGSDQDDNCEIYVMNADGSAPKRLTKTEGLDCRPSFSPDGSKIAYMSGSGISVMNNDGSEQKFVTSGTAPVFSPNGKKIFFVGANRGKSGEIYSVNLHGTQKRQVTHGQAIRTFCFSPDGKKIAFVSGEEAGAIYLMNASANHTVRLCGCAPDSPLCFSPDGRNIVFTRTLDNLSSIYTVKTDGSGEKRLSQGMNFVYPSWGSMASP